MGYLTIETPVVSTETIEIVKSNPVSELVGGVAYTVYWRGGEMVFNQDVTCTKFRWFDSVFDPTKIDSFIFTLFVPAEDGFSFTPNSVTVNTPSTTWGQWMSISPLSLKKDLIYIWAVKFTWPTNGTSSYIHNAKKSRFYSWTQGAFEQQLPSYFKLMGPERSSTLPPGTTTTPEYAPPRTGRSNVPLTIGLEFIVSNNTIVEIPAALEIYKNINQFNLTLPASWRVKEMKEWEIEYAMSSNNATWSEWINLGVLAPSQITYVHSNVDPAKYYRYRYQVKQRAYRSNWSEITQAGQPLTAPASASNPAPGTVTSVELADDAVTAAKLADGAVVPASINQSSATFTFPAEVSATALRARSTGVIFPDGTTQTTSATGGSVVSKYAQDVGTITADTPITITHSLNTKDVDINVYNISTGVEVEVNKVVTTVNAITLTFRNSYSTGVFRVVVMA